MADVVVLDFAARMLIATRSGVPGLLPSRLAFAAAESLGAAGAVVSLFSPPAVQIPIGSSGPDASLAEQLQFTLQEGPALDAHRIGVPVLADSNTAAECWPDFHRELIAHTRFRSVAAIPLRRGRGVIGVLDLFFIEQLSYSTFPIHAAHLIGDLITDTLIITRYLTDSDELGPTWLINHGTQPRGRLSIAMGAICVRRNVTANTALTLIRAHAVAHGMTVDDVVRYLLDTTLSIKDFSPRHGPD